MNLRFMISSDPLPPPCFVLAVASSYVTSTSCVEIPVDLQDYVVQDNFLFTTELQQWENDQSIRDQAKTEGRTAYGPWMPSHYDSAESGTSSGSQTVPVFRMISKVSRFFWSIISCQCNG